ncbi:MAG: DNA polymerase I, partial [Magnetospirillum sp.]|nr:DNA polymerase I [Magnetospirillum sp.]
MTAPRHVYLIDGSGFIFRAFHGLPPMTRPDGVPVNAVYGFTTMLMKLLADTDADHVAVIFDSARKTFRSDIYPQYKAHRPPAPEELVPQFPLVREATRAFDLPAIELEGFEADDLIATYARLATEAGARVTIVSSDKDLMQLVGPGVEMYDPMKNRIIGDEQVREKFGIGPDKVVDVQALCGDSSDNVPGVPGIGVKTAAQLIEEYGDLDTLLARASEIKQPKRRESLIEHAELARISRQLVRLRVDAPVPVPLSEMAVKPPAPDKLAAFCAAQGFRSLVGRLGGGKAPAAVPVASPLHASQAAPAAASLPAIVATEYELVTDLAALDRWVAAATRAGLVGVDTETTGLDPMKAQLVGVSLAVAPGKACYIPLLHNPPQAQGSLDLGGSGPAAEAPKLIAPEQALARLRILLADPAVLKVG